MNIKAAKFVKNDRNDNLRDDDKHIEVVTEVIITTTELITKGQLKQQIADIDADIAILEAKRLVIENKLKDINKKL